MNACVTDIPKDHKNDEPVNDTLVNDSSAQELALFSKPSGIFIQLAEYMDSCGYRPDTAMKGEKSEYFPLVISDYNDHIIHDFLKTRLDYGRAFQDVSNYSPAYDSIFSSVRRIFAYHWDFGPAQDGLKRKGTVEEWVFSSSDESVKAYHFLVDNKSMGGFPFFQTLAYYVRSGPYLYIFYSWNSGVAYRHTRFYKWLAEKCRNEESDLEMSSN